MIRFLQFLIEASALLAYFLLSIYIALVSNDKYLEWPPSGSAALLWVSEFMYTFHQHFKLFSAGPVWDCVLAYAYLEEVL